MSSRKQKLEASLEGLFSGPKIRPAAKSDLTSGQEKNSPAPDEAAGVETPAPISEALTPVAVSAEPEKPAKATPVPAEKPKSRHDLPVPAKGPKTISAAETPVSIPAKPPSPEAPVTIAAKPSAPNLPVKPARQVTPVEAEVRPGIELKAIDEGLQIVTFRLKNSFYGVDIAAVQTIIKPQAVCPVPFTASYIEGLTNLRGQIVPIIDLRKRLGFPEAEIDKDTRVIVVSILNEWAGIRVDEVTGVTTLASNTIEAADHVVSSAQGSLLSGIARKDQELILLLDIPAVFAVSERAIHRTTKSVLDEYQ